MLDGSELDGPPPIRRSSTTDNTPHQGSRLTRRASLDDLEQESCQLNPKIENRIVILDNEEVIILSTPEKHLLLRYLQKRQELLLIRQRYEQDSVIPEVDENSP